MVAPSVWLEAHSLKVYVLLIYLLNPWHESHGKLLIKLHLEHLSLIAHSHPMFGNFISVLQQWATVTHGGNCLCTGHSMIGDRILVIVTVVILFGCYCSGMMSKEHRTHFYFCNKYEFGQDFIITAYI